MFFGFCFGRGDVKVYVKLDSSEFARSFKLNPLCLMVELGLVETNVHIQWNPAHKACHRIRSYGNEPIVQ